MAASNIYFKILPYKLWPAFYYDDGYEFIYNGKVIYNGPQKKYSNSEWKHQFGIRLRRIEYDKYWLAIAVNNAKGVLYGPFLTEDEITLFLVDARMDNTDDYTFTYKKHGSR